MKKPFPRITSLAAMLYASLLLSCSSDIEMPPPPLPPDELSSSSEMPSSSSPIALSSSSSSGTTLSSSSTQPPSNSSSNLNLSSSSSIGSSDLCAGFVDGTTREHYGKTKAQFCDPRDGKKYVYVTIGEQVWMAENLNYEASGSKCHNDDPAECVTYRKLYNWATAMALQASCNSSSCASQVSAKYKGICPSGWHLPSDAEWGVLMQSVNPSCSLTGDCANAGTKLKAISGWNSYNFLAGSDTYEFSALPGGGLNFNDVGNLGYWWSSSEYDSYHAYLRNMRYDSDKVVYNDYGKSYLFSVRCLKD